MLVVEGLPDDRVALLVKMHHSTVDGITGANLIGDLFDLTPTRDPVPTRSDPVVARAPNPVELLGRTLLDRLTEPVDIIRLIPATVGHIGAAIWKLALPPVAAPGWRFRSPRPAPRSTAQ